MRSVVTKQANEKLTPDQTRALVRGLMVEVAGPLTWGVKWALILSAAAFLVSVLSLILVLR